MRSMIERRAALLGVLLVVVLVVTGCAAKQLMELAQTPEDKADTLVRIFDSYHEAGANLMENPFISDREKRVLAKLEAPAAAGAQVLLTASGDYRRVRAEIAAIREAGGNPDDIILTSLGVVLRALELAIRDNQAPISRFTGRISKNLPDGTASSISTSRGATAPIYDEAERTELASRISRTGLLYGNGAMASR